MTAPVDHKHDAKKSLRVCILTLSSSRTLAEDESGNWIKQKAIEENHQVVFHRVVHDDERTINITAQEIVSDHEPDVLIMTGGTGIARKDVTIEAVKPTFKKELTGFGPVFAQLSYAEVGSASILSRATAGIIGKTIVFCLPGNLNACKLACNLLIFPEICHIVKHIRES